MSEVIGEDGNVEYYQVYVAKPDMKFNAAHFVAFKGFRERLHGHNYRIAVRLMGKKVNEDGYVIDFGDVKKHTKALCKEINEHLILPMNSDVIEYDLNNDKEIRLKCEDGSEFLFPKDDCAMLPIRHSTAEELANYFWNNLLASFGKDILLERGIYCMEVKVEEAPNQEAIYTRTIDAQTTTKINGRKRGLSINTCGDNVTKKAST